MLKYQRSWQTRPTSLQLKYATGLTLSNSGTARIVGRLSEEFHIAQNARGAVERSAADAPGGLNRIQQALTANRVALFSPAHASFAISERRPVWPRRALLDESISASYGMRPASVIYDAGHVSPSCRRK